MKHVHIFLLSFYCCMLFPLSVCGQTQNVQETEERLLKEAAENIEQYRKGDVVIQFNTASGDPVRNATVEVRQTSHDFLFGALLFDLVGSDDPVHDARYKQLFGNLFNYGILPFYWPSYEPTPGMPRWEDMLPVIEWANANGITVKGHPLVWASRSGAPRWLSGYTVEETEEVLKARVINTVNAFKNDIHIWDVVNEPVNCKTWKQKVENLEDENDWGKQEPIQDIADYVEKAFRWAYSADPSANYVLNEYYQIADLTVRKRFYDLANELKKRNVPLCGLGIQAHEPGKGTEWYTPQDVWDTFDYLGSLGYTLHITEVMAWASGKEITGGWRTGTWTPELQADFAEQFYRLSFGHPSIASINWWGFVENNSVYEHGLVDENMIPRPVYQRLYGMFHEEWRTNLSASPDRNGEMEFRGFFGDYDITLKTEDGAIRSFAVHVAENEENRWVFTIGD